MSTSTDTPTPASSPADTAHDILTGVHTIADLAEAGALIAGDAGEILADAIEPVAGVLAVIEMFWDTLTALETEERGCGRRGWCYAVMYGALDMGSPPEPTFQGSLQGPDQDTLDQQAWEQGVADGQQALQNDTDGVVLRNKLLLRAAHDTDPAVTLNALWQAACAKADDTELARAFDHLPWPTPVP